MKPDLEVDLDAELATVGGEQIVGDVIGNTAYSQRFVLRNLLKLSNLDTIKEELDQKSFEDDLCMLWDMTTECDVVFFLMENDALRIFFFALPAIESPRIMELVVGIMVNMCCQRRAVAAIREVDGLVPYLLEFVGSNECWVVIQLLRLVSSCVVAAEDDDLPFWMNNFELVGYSNSLYFILKNSLNRSLLVAALENLNTLTTCCNVEKYRSNFYAHFVTEDALESLQIAFTETAVKQRGKFDTADLERILVICVQITLNFTGFETSLQLFSESRSGMVCMIKDILVYYSDKLRSKELDEDLPHIVESFSTIINILELYNVSSPKDYFKQFVEIWSLLNAADKAGVEEDAIKQIFEQIDTPLSCQICNYIFHCHDKDMGEAMNTVGSQYKEVLMSTKDEDLKKRVSNRISSYKAKLK